MLLGLEEFKAVCFYCGCHKQECSCNKLFMQGLEEANHSPVEVKKEMSVLVRVQSHLLS